MKPAVIMVLPATPCRPAAEITLRTTRIALVVAAAWLTTLPAFAADPSTDEKIRYLLQGLDSAADTDAAFEAMKSAFSTSFRDMPPEALNRQMVLMRREFDNIFSDKTTLYVDVYKTIYTTKEIDFLYSTFKTPEGRAIIAKQGSFAREINGAMADRSNLFYRNYYAAAASDPELRRLIEKPPKDL